MATEQTPNTQIAARKLDQLQKDLKEIKAQIGKSPLRIEPPVLTGFVSEIRTAIVQEDAPHDVKIKANLCDRNGIEITTGEGSNIDVYCDIFARSFVKLDGCLPKLKIGREIPITRRTVDNEGTPEQRWYCLWWFNDSTECECQ